MCKVISLLDCYGLFQRLLYTSVHLILSLPGLSYLGGSTILNGNFYLCWKLCLLCCINESWQVTPLYYCRNNCQQPTQMLSPCARAVCLSLDVYAYLCPYMWKKDCQNKLQLEMLREQLKWNIHQESTPTLRNFFFSNCVEVSLCFLSVSDLGQDPWNSSCGM